MKLFGVISSHSVLRRFASGAVSVSLAFAFAGAAPGQQSAKKETPPPASKPVNKPFPTFAEKTLVNGLRIIVVENHEQPSVSLRLAIPAGSAYDPQLLPGLSSFTASLLTQGTKTRKAQEIAVAVDERGGSLNAGAGLDTTVIEGTFFSNQVAFALETLADVTLNPAFSEDEIERTRTQTLSALKQQMEDPSYLAEVAFDRLTLGDAPYAHPAAGTPGSVAAFKRTDIAEFHKRFYIPNNSLLAIAGDVKPDEAFELAEKALGNWRAGISIPLTPTAFPTNKGIRIVILDKPDSEQTHIRVGQPGVDARDPDKITARVMNGVLGAAGFLARLNQEVREKRGLSYGASSSLSINKLPGTFQMSTYTKNSSTVEVVKLLLAEARRLQDEPIPAEELEARKAYLTGRFVLNNETPEAAAAAIANALLFGNGKVDLDTFQEKTLAVSAADIQKFARARITPNQFTIVLVGRAAEFEKDLAGLGTVEKIPYSDVDLTTRDLRRAKSGS